ncbi:hypothetical protein HYFRA_00004610 [Hymenoscyphus fraxineus]|uniref:Uncharacterized protein n=1 Tax=Hymenoscyphus fraxineus TaxID=746836 RepID=A0A9N9KY30_9HELO|nr:hypothetical protein HYFRA_00004610 [Hymenoscyphus fraxineus]
MEVHFAWVHAALRKLANDRKMPKTGLERFNEFVKRDDPTKSLYQDKCVRALDERVVPNA